MRDYIAIYKRQQIELQANSSYEAQVKAAKMLKVKHAYEVTVMLADVVHTGAEL